ncbi:MAG: calcium-translocating P-type ATPase, PMCA-type [Clostridia bacterium]|nr:calcium-translocating P-type ATPase, PMCA-type [Clostridia bacterium]
MEFYSKSVENTLTILGVNKVKGLSSERAKENLNKYGLNQLTKQKEKSLLAKIFDSLKEPMLIILMFSFTIAFGANLGKYLKTGQGDFAECFGILFAIILSVAITLFMEGSSKKAFDALNKIYDNLTVKVIRDGVKSVINQKFLTVGDIVLLESGDKVVADGRIIESNYLSMDESTLTGESKSSKKDENSVLNVGTPLAERNNVVYSGTFVSSGNGKMVVTSVGDSTEIGSIAKELVDKKSESTPLQHKLSKLGKTISIIGTVCALIVFIMSVIKLYSNNSLNFESVGELFISCIILIVAAVPEGLPTIVAVSLALNMIKMAKENALIKKMTATETAGAVSVICSDKTGTLTQNKMQVKCICGNGYCSDKKVNDYVLNNVIYNSTAEKSLKNKREEYRGNKTECALLNFISKEKSLDLDYLRSKKQIINRIPFSSEKKFMLTEINEDGKAVEYVKGAPEKILEMCGLSLAQKLKNNEEIRSFQKNSGRVICFAHRSGEEKYIYDGFAVIVDPVRPEVKKAVRDCKSAGIGIKILTGDNVDTALAVAKELGICESSSEVINATELERLSEEDFFKAISNLKVIARSTPLVKLRVVESLKKHGEVVAVTGDGINDAPAIKKADVGIAMGVEGSEITKESADIVLLDDSFATVVKAVSFGRNVYKNLQRFIMFQLSVNLSALIFITISNILGLDTPFNTFQLLWINVIMDGPPALTLGLEPPSDKLMKFKPIKRHQSIVGLKTLLRIIFNGLFISVIMILQYTTNFLKVGVNEKSGVIFTLFILFQLFNAFNCRELGSQSIFKGLNKNKVMLFTFLGVFVLHFLMVQVFYNLFNVNPLSLTCWIKCLSLSSSIILITEVFKLLYRLIFEGDACINLKGFSKKQRVFGNKN